MCIAGGRIQAYTIGLSINEDPKLDKGKEKNSRAAQSFIQSSNHVATTAYHFLPFSAANLPFSTSAVIFSIF
jgi:hypothetical protein